MEDIRTSELSDKYKKFREKNKSNLDIDFDNNLLTGLNTLFILPELEKWEKERKVTSNYIPEELLIKKAEPSAFYD